MPSRREYYNKDGVLYFKCKDCGEFKTGDSFYKHSKCFMGISNICKVCDAQRGAKYHSEHREEQNRKHRDARQKNKDEINARKMELYRTSEDYRKLCSERAKIWREENREENLKHHKEYYANNKDTVAMRGREYYERNKERILRRNKQYASTHRELINKTSSEWKKGHRDLMNISQQSLRARRGPLFSKAHRMVEKKLKELGIKRTTCPICSDDGIVVCHHPDYNKPYEVVPCCNMCHSKIHNGLIECPEPIDLLKL